MHGERLMLGDMGRTWGGHRRGEGAWRALAWSRAWGRWGLGLLGKGPSLLPFLPRFIVGTRMRFFLFLLDIILLFLCVKTRGKIAYAYTVLFTWIVSHAHLTVAPSLYGVLALSV